MESSPTAAEEHRQLVTEEYSDGVEMKNSSKINEKLSERGEKSSTSNGKNEMNGLKKENGDRNSENKEAEKKAAVKRRPLSTKSSRSNDLKDRGKRREPVIAVKGKHTVKRRSSSSDVVKGKGHLLSKKISKRPEASGHTSAVDSGSQLTGSKVSVKEDTVKLQDPGVRPQSSSSKHSDKSNGNGFVVVDSDVKAAKSKTSAQDNKSKTFGIKKSWQKLKSAKVNGKRLISSQGNGSLPLSNDVKAKQDIDNVSKSEVPKSKEKIAEKPKSSSEVKGALTPDFIQNSPDSPVLANDESSQLSAEPVIQYGNGVKYNEDERTKSLVSSSEPWIQSAIPYLPLGLSVICLLMNIIIPGSGKNIFHQFTIL